MLESPSRLHVDISRSPSPEAPKAATGFLYVWRAPWTIDVTDITLSIPPLCILKVGIGGTKKKMDNNMKMSKEERLIHLCTNRLSTEKTAITQTSKKELKIPTVKCNSLEEISKKVKSEYEDLACLLFRDHRKDVELQTTEIFVRSLLGFSFQKQTLEEIIKEYKIRSGDIGPSEYIITTQKLFESLQNLFINKPQLKLTDIVNITCGQWQQQGDIELVTNFRSISKRMKVALRWPFDKTEIKEGKRGQQFYGDSEPEKIDIDKTIDLDRPTTVYPENQRRLGVGEEEKLNLMINNF